MFGLSSSLNSPVQPVRQCEFARASLQRSLRRTGPEIKYFGFLRPEQKDVTSAIFAAAYEHWDASTLAPAKTRPRPQDSQPVGLQLLTWASGSPGFPLSLLTRFDEGTAEHEIMKKRKASFETQFPPSPATVQTGQAPRAGGRPDYSTETPLDLTRLLELATVSEVPDEVLARCAGRQNKPSLCITKKLDVWLGNETTEVLQLSAGELFGFNTGNFEERIVRGPVAYCPCCEENLRNALHACLMFWVSWTGEIAQEKAMLVWRLKDDFTVVSANKILHPLCEYLRKCITTQGIGELEIVDHVFAAKMFPAVRQHCATFNACYGIRFMLTMCPVNCYSSHVFLGHYSSVQAVLVEPP